MSEIIKIYGTAIKDGKILEEMIEASEEQRYLSCKFWHKSATEAQLFGFYYPTNDGFSAARIIGILSGEFLKASNIDKALEKIYCAIDLYHQPPLGEIKWIAYKPTTKFEEKEISHLQPMIEAIDLGFRSKEIGGGDDIYQMLKWARTKECFLKDQLDIAEQKILATQRPVFINETCTASNIHIVKQIILNRHSILYEDAKQILFSDLNISHELRESVKNGELYVNMQESLQNTLCPKPLIKWLMSLNYLSARLIDEFEELKIEQIKESQKQIYNENIIFSSLEKLTHTGNNKDDLIQSALRGENAIYLRHHREVQWVKKQKLDDINLPKVRYKGYGQLKKTENDDSHTCQFGGYTLDMLMLGKPPYHYASKDKYDKYYEIEFVPTYEEAKYGLQPLIKIPKNKVLDEISDKNLGIIAQIDKKSAPSKSLTPLVRLNNKILESIENNQLLESAVKHLYDRMDTFISFPLDSIKEGMKDLTPTESREYLLKHGIGHPFFYQFCEALSLAKNNEHHELKPAINAFNAGKKEEAVTMIFQLMLNELINKKIDDMKKSTSGLTLILIKLPLMKIMDDLVAELTKTEDDELLELFPDDFIIGGAMTAYEKNPEFWQEILKNIQQPLVQKNIEKAKQTIILRNYAGLDNYDIREIQWAAMNLVKSHIEINNRDDDLLSPEKAPITDVPPTNLLSNPDSSEDKKTPVPLNDETLKHYEAGKKISERNTGYSKKGAKAKKEQAEEKYKPLLLCALTKAKSLPKHYSANQLSAAVATELKIKPGKLRYMLSSDPEIAPLLRPHGNRKQKN